MTEAGGTPSFDAERWQQADADAHAAPAGNGAGPEAQPRAEPDAAADAAPLSAAAEPDAAGSEAPDEPDTAGPAAAEPQGAGAAASASEPDTAGAAAAEPEGLIPFPVPDDVADQSPEELAAALAAVCFALNRPVTLAEAAAILGRSEAVLNEAADHLAGTLRGGGLMLQRHQSEIQLVTRPEVAWAVQRALNPEKPGRLSRAALETLAIVAYRQPLTRAGVEAIRGVNCEAVLDSLERRGLIAEVGRQDTPGHPRLFGTTLRFLQVVGLERIGDLPPLPEGLKVPELPAADWADIDATPEPPQPGDIEVRGLAADPDEGYGDDLDDAPAASDSVEAAIEDAFDAPPPPEPEPDPGDAPDGDDAER